MRTTVGIATAAIALTAAFVLSGCSGQESGSAADLAGTVVTDGSSTVGPLTKAAAIEFEAVEPEVVVTVSITGTGGGFRSFCRGETDLSNASRPISEDEIDACAEAGVEYTEIVIANDGLSVVVNPANDWIQCITVEQLQTIWAPEAEGEVTSWNQVDPEFPDEPLVLHGPGGDSGTFDYFTEAINGEEGATRTDYGASEDDDVIVAGVTAEDGGMGYFGLSYVEENPDLVTALEVDSGDGCVAPTVETVQDGSYAPLGRPLFIYVNNASYAEEPQVEAFVDFYVDNADEIAERASIVPLTDEQTELAAEELASVTG
ncbi:hypothetical protein ARHIZOSPH14_01050 [Agromyces rhizosphaerae]|uniref:Phosphate-binding protein n=1 Tax=Agromyces rhizosphaerae TaxID=88374 RepID=A0A9W6FQ99_9MICO|nr:PstS family phosphate ABC transporter substrate-binding protein [Agromyces rhizosphaerae]GLI25863.1 hypothetical protein ARHIZOSPH14_01050 [Agromyces rhizosphaerae]